MKTLIRQTQAKIGACGFRWEKAKAKMWPMYQDPAPGTGVAGQWYRIRGPKLPPVPLNKTQTRRAQRQYATTCKAELEWADKRQAQLDRLVKLREKLRLEELELPKADAVASLEAASAEEMKVRWEWVNGLVMVTAPEEPISELEAHLTRAFKIKKF
ncbi:unnamed protein product [Prunus armeniaca]